MALSRRERRHEQTRQEIKQIARQQMTQQGITSLSLRGIAASMGMSAPSLSPHHPPCPYGQPRLCSLALGSPSFGVIDARRPIMNCTNQDRS
ncbi:MAG TPA: TetR/AcrR family transcriptional regulator [Ktedonobacteraceae bacterium]